MSTVSCPNPRRAAAAVPVYRLGVDVGFEPALALVRALRALLVAGAVLAPCPACDSIGATVLGERDSLRCGACGHEWLDAVAHARVAREWNRRAKLTTIAARAVLPRSVRYGECLRVAVDDLDGWGRFGIADAILGRRPAHLPAPTSPPWALAYCWGWTAAWDLLVRTDPVNVKIKPLPQDSLDVEPKPEQVNPAPEQDPAQVGDGPGRGADIDETPQPIPPVIAFALVAAQAAAASLGRDAKNKQHDYKYTSSDVIAEAARQLLTAQGLAFCRCGVMPTRSRGLAQAEIGNQYYVGDVVIDYALIHKSGAAWFGRSIISVIATASRPHDKAQAAAVTYATGQILMGLLCLDREARDGTSVDSRSEPRQSGHDLPAPRPAKIQRAQRRTPPKPTQEREQEPWSTDPQVADDIHRAITRLAQATGAEQGEVFIDARRACKVPATIRDANNKTLPVDRVARMRVSEALAVRKYLQGLEQRAPGEPPDYVASA